MSLTKDALQHLEQSHKTGTAVAGGHALVIGDSFTVQDMEKYQEGRRRFRGTFTTEGLEAFTRYVGQRAEAQTPVFIDRDSMRAQCYLDIGTLGEPGHCDHQANLKLPRTPEFQTFVDHDGRHLDQEALVALIEDWGHLMVFINSKGEELELRKVIAAVRNVSIDDLTRIESEQQEHSSRTGIMNSVKVNNAERLPTVIQWQLVPYDGLTSRQLSMRVSTHTKGKPAFTLRAIALEAAAKEMAEEFAGLITDALPECECLQGAFKA